MDDDFLIAWCACPSRQVADRLAEALVERRAAACVTTLPGARSTYRWDGEIERTDEVLLMIKTRAACWPSLESIVAELHPYDVPELIASPLCKGAPAYLQWLADSTP